MSNDPGLRILFAGTPDFSVPPLKALIENAGRILSKHQLESKLYEWGEEVASNTIEVHISHLRKKMPDDFIRTIRGVGYCISKSGD